MLDPNVFILAAEIVESRFGDKYLSTCRAIGAASQGLGVDDYVGISYFGLDNNRYIDYFESFMSDEELDNYNGDYLEHWGMWYDPLPEGREARVLALLLCAEELKFEAN